MKTVRFLLEKEFRQIFRNKILLTIILFVPVVQLLILPLAANYEVKNINISVVDNDRSPYAQKLIGKITASGYFRLTSVVHTYAGALDEVEDDQADLILEIPHDFEKQLVREKHETLFVAVNAINGIKAGLGTAYLHSIIRDFNSDILVSSFAGSRKPPALIDIVPSNWYNPYMRYQLFMVPGILAILVTMIAGYLSALNIVKEKETGTIEQINVTPIRKHHFIIGKLIPFWILGLVVFTVGLLIGRIAYGIWPLGSLALLYFFLAIYLFAVLGLGLLISTYAETQQQAMFIAFFFVMIFILMSGLFTSIDSMPGWAQVVSHLNPVTYFIQVMRMIVLKGSGLRDILPHIGAVVTFALILNSWAVINYKKTS